MQKFNKTIYKGISLIAHPVFVFPVLTIIYFERKHLYSFLAVLGFSFLLPFIFFLYLYRTKKISNFEVTEHKQRTKLYFASLAGLSLSILYLYIFSSSEIVIAFRKLLFIAFSLILINFRVKISIHTALITVFCFSLVRDFNTHPVIFLLVPLVGYSRLKLKKHHILDIILGALIPTLFYLM